MKTTTTTLTQEEFSQLNYLERIAVKNHNIEAIKSLIQVRRDRNKFLHEQIEQYSEKGNETSLYDFNIEMVGLCEKARVLNWHRIKLLRKI